MLRTLKCGLQKRILHIIVSSNCPYYGNLCRNHWASFPNHATEVRHTQGSRKLVPRVMGSWDSAGHKWGMRGTSLWLPHTSLWKCLGGSAETWVGVLNWSSHRIISDWKFWEVSNMPSSVSHGTSQKGCGAKKAKPTLGGHEVSVRTLQVHVEPWLLSQPYL